MKTTKSFIVILFALLTAQAVLAWYDPSTQRWLSRDPIGEPGFQVLQNATQMMPSPQMASPPQQRRWIARDPVKEKEQGGINRYGYVANNPINDIDPFGLLSWSQAGEAIWRAAGYIVPGGEFPTAFEAAPDCAKIAIESKFKKACEACMDNSPDGNCPVCDDYERVKAKLNP